jgi:hypothetical protein
MAGAVDPVGWAAAEQQQQQQQVWRQQRSKLLALWLPRTDRAFAVSVLQPQSQRHCQR